MNIKTVPSTEFQNHAGRYIDDAGTGPVVITRHQRPVRVLLHIDEYERLKSYDTRKALYPHELPDDLKAELEQGYPGDPTPELDRLLG
jgi:prevent-host-death family protein